MERDKEALRSFLTRGQTKTGHGRLICQELVMRHLLFGMIVLWLPPQTL